MYYVKKRRIELEGNRIISHVVIWVLYCNYLTVLMLCTEPRFVSLPANHRAPIAALEGSSA